LLILILALPSLGLILYSGLHRQKYEIEKAKSNALNIVYDIAFQQGQIVESARVFLMTLSKLPEVQNKNIDKCDQLFSALLKERQLYANIFAVTGNGIIFSSALPYKSQTVTHRKFYRDAIMTKTFSIGEFGIGDISKHPILSFAYPVLSTNGKIKAIVGVTLNLTRYSNIFSLSRLPEGSQLVLTDYKDLVIYHYPDREEYIGKPDTPKIIKQMQSQEDAGTFIDSDTKSAKRLYAYKKLRLKEGELPYLTIRIGIPEKTALAAARQILIQNLISVSAISIVALFFFWFIGDMLITKKVDKLAYAAKRLGLGDLKARTGMNHEGGELSQLAKAFDEMAEELENRREELLLSEEKYRSIFENAVEGIFRSTLDGRFLNANPALAEMFGFQSPQEFIEAVTDIENQLYVNPDDRKMLKELYEKQDAVSCFEARLYRKDKSILWISLNARAVRDADGKIICYEGTAEDISERKEAEESLKSEKGKLFAILENDPMGIALIDRNGIYQYINPAFTNITGYTLQDVPTGREWFQKAYPDQEYRKKVIDAWERGRLPEGGRGADEEFTIQCKDGQTKDIEFRTTYLKEYSITVLMDITERKQAEEKVHILNQELEQHVMELKTINASLEILTFSLAHDLRTPLVAIGGFSRRLVEKYDDCIDERGQQYLKIINTNIMHMEELISDLLTFFKLGGKPTQHSQVKMNLMVQETFDQLKAIYHDRVIELNTKNIPDARGDGNMLKQVLVNLMTNAVKYAKPNGIIVIEVAGLVENEENVYYVKDSGIGFSMKYADKIFEIFERLHTKEEIEGTGLGLAIVKRIVKQHGGRVWAEAEIGKGATFYFTIPR
jgi:PAS domain S-box-containing protein